MSCYFWPILTPPVTLCLTACHKIPVMSEMMMFNALDRLRPTAEGHDGLPAWYLRLLAPICSRSLTHLVNLSVLQSCVPRQWKTAIIHPVPKVQNPSTPAEYRPISVVSILSRIVERIIVHSYIYPAFLKPPVVENIKDQFDFRPTDSTTAAVIDLLQQTTTMLLTNNFVVIISLDFTKPFDTIRHQTLLQKMCSLDLPDHIYNSIGWSTISTTEATSRVTREHCQDWW